MISSELTYSFNGALGPLIGPVWSYLTEPPTPEKSIAPVLKNSTNILNIVELETWLSATKSFSATEYELYFVETETLGFQTKQVLGSNATKRFEFFKQYKSGWDAGRGLPLSPRSVAVMESFISFFSDFKKEPSLFLTLEGNLQLGWEDKDNRSIEIEFFPDRIEYYLESLDEEQAISLTYSEICKFSNRLSSLT